MSDEKWSLPENALVVRPGDKLELEWKVDLLEPTISIPFCFYTQHGDGFVCWQEGKGLTRLGYGAVSAQNVLFSDGTIGRTKARRDGSSGSGYWQWCRRTSDGAGWWPGELRIEPDRLIFNEADELPDSPILFEDALDRYDRDLEHKFESGNWPKFYGPLRFQNDIAKDAAFMQRIQDDEFALVMAQLGLVGKSIYHYETMRQVCFFVTESLASIIARLRRLGESYLDFEYIDQFADIPEERRDVLRSEVAAFYEQIGYIIDLEDQFTTE